MEGEVKISLSDLDNLRYEASEYKTKYEENTAHLQLFLGEVNALLNLIYAREDIAGLIAEFNKVSESGHIAVDTTKKEIELQLIPK